MGSISIVDLNLTRYDQILTRFQQYAAQATDYLKSGIATRNAVFNRLIDEIEQVATRSHAPILLEGPTGAGKSFLAKRIYQLKARQHQLDGAFVEVNCATLRGDSAMSALFGHVKGAFTGAEKERAGLLRQADGGMLFLDEINWVVKDGVSILAKQTNEARLYAESGAKGLVGASGAKVGNTLKADTEVKLLGGVIKANNNSTKIK